MIQTIEDVILFKKAWSIFGTKSSNKHVNDLIRIEENYRNKILSTESQ